MSYNDNNNPNQQRDIVLSPNEYLYVQSNTNGIIKTHVGPSTITISAQDTIVKFNDKTKRFETAPHVSDAKGLFISPPESWYAILKNPAKDDTHPEPGKPNNSPELRVGEKVNIKGPISFALYPGQMAKVIKGHSLRSNQYLLARVYDAEKASQTQGGKVIAADGAEAELTNKTAYITGQILVIKGTEVSFYIPPTGIEVIPIHNDADEGYVRDAITLENLEYCILKDEDGNKRYVHGPAVVFPEPTENFVSSPKGGNVFRAIELSPISGIYVKVITEYSDEDGTVHPVGEEMFITGNSQMIYYPRPEHAIISYDNKMMHHAIAIPEGEGRYIMNRLTGEIKTIKGPAMYLPDPRNEVVVKRKLTTKQCSLWFPGNKEAMDYNSNLNEKYVEKSLKSVDMDAFAAFMCASSDSSLANLEAKANISRGTSYTKPRTITIDSKYDGVVSVDVWTGYAVNKVSKNGSREVICGPTTILLDYDESFEEVALSTGKPKTTDTLEHTVFLNYRNNKISDIINVETKDFVTARVKVSYTVNFDEQYKERWFDVSNYVKYVCDRERSLIKAMAKEYTIEEFYQQYNVLVKNIAIDNLPSDGEKASDSAYDGRFFRQNGMWVTDCEVLSLDIQDDVAQLIEEHQKDMIQKTLELTDASKRIAIAEKLSEATKKEFEVRSLELVHKMELQRKEAARKLEIQAEMNRLQDAERRAAAEAERDLQVLLDATHEAKMLREKKESKAKLEVKRQEAAIEKARQEAYAATVAKVMESISEDLVAAMTTKSNNEMTAAVAESLAPYALASGTESVSDVVNKLLRGTALEEVVKDVNLNI